MKTTIKIDASKSLVVEPAPGGGVLFTAKLHGFNVGSHVGTPDQCGVLVFAIEQALRQAEQVQQAEVAGVKSGGCTGNCNQGRNCTCRVPA